MYFVKCKNNNKVIEKSFKTFENAYKFANTLRNIKGFKNANVKIIWVG